MARSSQASHCYRLIPAMLSLKQMQADNRTDADLPHLKSGFTARCFSPSVSPIVTGTSERAGSVHLFSACIKYLDTWSSPRFDFVPEMAKCWQFLAKRDRILTYR